jgi:hypothetical protein
MGMMDGRTCIPSRELTWDGMYLNKRTNYTEERKLKHWKEKRFFEKNEMVNNKKRNKDRNLESKKG